MVSEIQNVQSAFKVYDSWDFWWNLDTTCHGNFIIPSKWLDFILAGYTKYTCVYGILIAGDSLYPDNNILYAANVLAYLLDS